VATGDEGRSMQFIDPKGSFLKNLVLSLLLLGLSSLLIPAVLKQIDDQKFVAEQQFQAELSRQDKILDAQAAVLDSLASTFWDYEGYAADLLYSRDERYGRDEWHQRAIEAYYLESGPVLGKMRAEISTLLRLAPRPNYESFLRLYEEEVLPLDSCLLELMKLEAESSGASLPTGCVASEGKFFGASWDTLAAYVFKQDLADQVDRELESLAKAFGLQGAPD
jgi:hypothetical protein